MKKEKILVTGGNGFVGSHICVKLVKQGYMPVVICRRSDSKNPHFNDLVKSGAIEIFRGDITDFDYTQLPSCDHIIHVAGKVSPYGKLDDFVKINYNATQKLLDYAKKARVKCFTYISTASVYGYTGYRNIAEDYPKKLFGDPYSFTKLKTENLVQNFCKENSLDFVIIRPGNVYGEYDYTSSFEIYSRVKNQKMSICAGGKYESCFVYAGNLADAIILTTLDKSAHNTDYNCADSNITLRQYLTMVASTMGVKPKFINYPSILAKIVATMVEGSYKLFRIKKAPLITRFSIWQNCAHYSFSTAKLEKIGFIKQTDTKTAIKRTVDWFENNSDNKG